jgi:hypothetical protein
MYGWDQNFIDLVAPGQVKGNTMKGWFSFYLGDDATFKAKKTK